MMTSSPLRYPGGKSAMAGLLASIRRINGLGNRAIAEPFAGGAGASLRLLYLEEAQTIHINDADTAIFAFWWTLVHRPVQFLRMLSTVRVSMVEWRRQREVYRSTTSVSRLRRAFATFYLNRCNRSGIIMNGGPIGGVLQNGHWKLDARFNKLELRRRCEKVAEYADRIRVSDNDGIRFVESLDPKFTFFFIDPPYYQKGPTLYLNGLEPSYHERLAARLKTMQEDAWVLTYDDCPQVRKMYREWATIRSFSLRYTAARCGIGKEILIAPKWMRLPKRQQSAALRW